MLKASNILNVHISERYLEVKIVFPVYLNFITCESAAASFSKNNNELKIVPHGLSLPYIALLFVSRAKYNSRRSSAVIAIVSFRSDPCLLTKAPDLKIKPASRKIAYLARVTWTDGHTMAGIIR